MFSYRQNIKQELLLQIEILSERKLREVLNFARFLSYQEQPIDEQKAEYPKSQREILASLNQIRETGRQTYGVYQGDLVAEVRAEREQQLASRLGLDINDEDSG